MSETIPIPMAMLPLKWDSSDKLYELTDQIPFDTQSTGGTATIVHQSFSGAHEYTEEEKE